MRIQPQSEAFAFRLEAARDQDDHDYRVERHRQEMDLENQTGGYKADVKDYFDRGGKPLITYKDWMKGRAKSPAQLIDEQGPPASHEVYTPDPAKWGMPEEAPSW